MTTNSAKKSSAAARPARPAAAAGAATPPARSGPPAPVLTAVLVVFVLAVALGGWLLYGALNRPLATPADPAQLRALDVRLVQIENAARPIATEFTSETATAAIDISAYRAQAAALRDLVDSTNDLAATSPDALEIRDLILTGGSQISAGISDALDAAASDQASATLTAATRIDEGLSNLAAARAKLDLLLGRTNPA